MSEKLNVLPYSIGFPDFNSHLEIPELTGAKAKELPLAVAADELASGEVVFRLATPHRIYTIPSRDETPNTILFVADPTSHLIGEPTTPSSPYSHSNPLSLTSLDLIKPVPGEVTGLGAVSRVANREHKPRGYGKILFQNPSIINTIIENVTQFMPEGNYALQQSSQKIVDTIEEFTHSISVGFSENHVLKLSLPRAALIALALVYLGVASSVSACAPPTIPDQNGIKTEQAIQVPASVKFQIKPILIPYLETILQQKYITFINGQEKINPEFEAQKDKYFSGILAEQMKAIDRQFPNDKSKITILPSGIPSKDGYVYEFWLDGHEMVYTGFDTNGHKGFFTFAPEGARHSTGNDHYQFRLDGNRYSTVYFYYFEDKFGIIMDPETNIFIPEYHNLTLDKFYEKAKPYIVNHLRNMANLKDGRALGGAYTVFHRSFNLEDHQTEGILEIIRLNGDITRFRVFPNGRIDPAPLQSDSSK